MNHPSVVRYFVFTALTLSGFALTAHAGKWDDANSPTRLDSQFNYRFSDFPAEARVAPKNMPWADTYWPMNRGGIAARWNSKDPTYGWRPPHIKSTLAMFRYASPTREQAMKMSADDLAQLSPAEKYDLVRGDYQYSLTQQVLKSTSPNRADWEGYCHGWAPASVNHAEPLPVEAINPDGVVVPMGSADVKAILDYYYATVNPRVRQMGKRCRNDLNKPSLFGNADCEDVNAGAFHVVLANFVGIRKQPFVADVTRDREVWNNPIYQYRSQVQEAAGPARNSAPGTVKRLRLVTEVQYSSDDERLPPQWQATVGKPEMRVPEGFDPLNPAEYENVYRYDLGTYEYWLELDSADRIIGGTWISKDRPDYIWMKAVLPFTGAYSTLKQIYKPAY